MKIPKIIHHVWPGQDAFKYATIRNGWLEVHPDFTMMFHRNDCDFGSKVNQIVYDSCYTVTVKSDIIRLAALHKYGGIYVDTDMVCLKNLETLMDTPFLIGYEVDTIQRLGLSLIGCHSDDPTIKKCLDLSIANVLAAKKESVNKNSLTFCSIDAIQEIIKKDIADIKPQKYFYPLTYSGRGDFHQEIKNESYSVHLWMGMEPDGWTKQQIFA